MNATRIRIVGQTALLALIPVCFYAFRGYGGHDFRYHVTSWMEVHTAWQAHEWRLRWAEKAHFGLGEPRFAFYPPLTFLLGGLLTFLLPFRLVPGAMVWLVLLASGLAMYLASGDFIAKRLRLLAAALYMFNPCLLVTLFLRFAIAEAWVQALLPLLFLHLYRLLCGRRPASAAPLALGLGAAWLCNIPASIVLFYGFGLLAVAVSMRGRSIRPLVAFTLCELAALGIAAWRLAPAFVEQKLVSASALLQHDYRGTLQYVHVPPPHVLIYFYGLYMPVLSLLIALAVRRMKPTPWLLPLLTLAILAVFLQFRISTPVWDHLPELKFLQFAYRWLPLLGLGLPWLLLSEDVQGRTRSFSIAALLLMALFPFAAFSSLFPFQRFDSLEAMHRQWEQGFPGVVEYVPASAPPLGSEADELALRAHGEVSSAECPVSVSVLGPNQRTLSMPSRQQPCRLTLAVYYYPHWRAVTISHISLPLRPSASGLITLTVPAGEQQVSLMYDDETPLLHASALVSLASLAALFAWSAYLRRRTATVAASDSSRKQVR